MYRQLYQMGGIGTLPMDYGQSLQVPQQPQSMFTPTGSATSSPLLNYGQSQLGQAGGTPLTMRSGGISRLGYQEGGMGMTQLGAQQEEPIFPRLETLNQNLGQAEQTLGSPSNNQFNMSPMTSAFTGRPQMNLGGRIGYQEGGMDQMMEPQMQDPMMQEQMMQSQMQQAPEGIMSMMPQGTSGGQQGMPQEGGQEQTALLTIIQLLIEQGVPPEQAQELAMQILQVFNQGGAPAVEEFANQLEQEEGMPENRTMMAGGGITGIYPRQGYIFGKIAKGIGKAVKGVANAVKSVAKSPIGQIALAIAAPYAIGAMFPAFATLGGTGFMGAALRAGISNLAIQGITTGKFNPKQALMAAVGGGIAGEFFPQGGAPSGVDAGTVNAGGAGIVGADIAPPSTLTSGVTQSLPTSAFTELTGQVAPNSMVYNPPTNAAGVYPGLGYEVSPTSPVVNLPTNQPTGIMQSVQDFGTNLMNDPLKTIQTGMGSLYDKTTQLIKDNPYTAVGTSFLAGTQFRAPLAGEDPNEYNKLKAEHDAQVSAYITQYGGGANVYSPGSFGLYAREKAVDPFANRSPFTYAANGGRIGYANGTSLERQYLEKKGYGDMIRNMSESEILKLYDSVIGTFSRRFQAEGTMPMGEPRKNPAGIMELDYRQKGGFVPPVGIKEKADDIPAMLSNNEFVFTADAVRNAGGGNVNKGAQRMYGLMKQLEAGGRV
jgi:hypothetical protein